MKQSVIDLIAFFESVKLPKEVDMYPHGKITDVHKFVESHIKIVINQSGNARYLPYYERLTRLRDKLK